MHSVTFALLLWQSWIGVFGLYPDCAAVLGLRCTIDSGASWSYQCCDDIASGHFVYCYSNPLIPQRSSVWEGPGRVAVRAGQTRIPTRPNPDLGLFFGLAQASQRKLKYRSGIRAGMQICRADRAGTYGIQENIGRVGWFYKFLPARIGLM
jgi:hypothetical protein